MPPKKKVKGALANCWQPSTSVSNPSPSIVTISTSSDSENPESESNSQTQKHVSSSYIWDHGTKVIFNGAASWRCNYCRHILPSVSSTSNRRYHLSKKHQIKDPGDHADDQQTHLTPTFSDLFELTLHGNCSSSTTSSAEPHF